MAAEFGDEVALVTGGASGIGAACVRALLAAGARVVIADRSAEAAKELAAELGERTAATAADVSTEDGCAEMVRAAVEHFGRLDLAINNAGVGVPGSSPVGEISLETWRGVTSVNLDGVFLSMRAEIAAMLDSGGGAIVNMASVLGAAGVAGAAPYVAAKHGVVGLTKAAAIEYAQRGIRINALGPGFIDTPLLRDSGDWYDRIAAAHPMGRLGTAEETAQAAVFLLSPGASFLTGAYLPADGGYLAW